MNNGTTLHQNVEDCKMLFQHFGEKEKILAKQGFFYI